MATGELTLFLEHDGSVIVTWPFRLHPITHLPINPVTLIPPRRAEESEADLPEHVSLDHCRTRPRPWRSSRKNREYSVACQFRERSLTVSEPGSAFALTIQAMKERGVNLIYGRWLIEGAPRVLLFDTGSCYNR
jgi:hypothetical protein